MWIEIQLTLDVISEDQNAGIQTTESTKEPCVDLAGNQQIKWDCVSSCMCVCLHLCVLAFGYALTSTDPEERAQRRRGDAL